MRLIFAGTPEFAATALQALIQAGHDIALVLTQPDRPAGRGMQLKPSAVKVLSLQHGLNIAQPISLKDPSTHAALAAIQADLMIVAAYGLILPLAVLEIPRLGCLNIHASLLPRWRGAAPIQRALLAGDTQTGITIMQMDVGLDTGAMLLREQMLIATQDTALSLHDKLAVLGATTIVKALHLLQQGPLVAEAQAEAAATYAAKITKAEAHIDWGQDVATVARAVRAYNPVPGAFTVRAGESLKIWSANVVEGPAANDQNTTGTVLSADSSGIVVACGNGALCITELQRAGAKRLNTAQFLSGLAIAPGERWV